jgi:ATP-dependent DNA helicase RecQ
VLEAVVEVKEQFKAVHLINIIVGKTTANIKAFKHNNLNVFAKGADNDEKFWNAVIRQALIHRLLLKDIENYGILKISPDGKKFLEEPWSVMLTHDHDYENADDDDFVSSSAKVSTADVALFTMLKDLRKQISRKESLPPFVIFQDPSLEDMSIHYPVKMDELMQITGVGAGKAQKYGKPFLEFIAKYVEENEITRPMDMVVKSVINKSGLKVDIIRNIDRKVPLEDIAVTKSLTISDLINELEHIVGSGTKIDINYYIDQYIDPYHQEEIFEYFGCAETDSVEAALKELGEQEFTEEEIRLMRLKFMSEVGN